MILDIRAPAEQEGTRSQVLRWLKSPGDAVSANEPLVELETDKVTVEVPAPASGVLREIIKGEREELTPGELIGRMESGTAAEPRPVGAPARNLMQERAPRPEGTQTGKVTASGTPLSPAVKRLLAERGLDPSSVRGTGEGGRITVQDVLGHTGTPVADSAPTPSAPTAGGRLLPHSPIRARVAEHMVQSLLRTAPHVTTVFEADLGAVIAHRNAHRAELERRGASLTFTAYFLKAAVAAIRAVPEANSRWTDTALEIFDRIDIGVATALEGAGLIVPVLRDVQSRDLFDIATNLHDLVKRARAGKLQPVEMRGGTFTISNHGVSGSLLAAPIVINQPQSAILGIGRLEKRAVVVEGESGERIVARPRCYVTLTIDHRVMDGHQANRFLETFVASLARDFA